MAHKPRECVTVLSVCLLFLFCAFLDCGTNAYGFIRGVHYWGKAWPLNFWDGLERSVVDADFEKIKQDGFNTVVLAVPWGEFQPSISPVVFDEKKFKLLGWLVEKARSHGLDVILRVSYAWDYAPDVQFKAPKRFLLLHTAKEALDAWTDFLLHVWKTVSKAPNFLFGFLTWEDFWRSSMYMTTLPLRDRTRLAAKSGFQQFLKSHYNLNEIEDIYGHDFTSWEDVPLPAMRSRSIRLFYEYWDDFLVNTIYQRAQSVFKRLSLEVRVDADPILLKDGSRSWYYHDRQFNLNGSNIVTTYYSPAWGSKNQDDFIDASTALRLLETSLSRLKGGIGDRGIFIDQFNYYDNTPYALHNTAIYPDQLNKFIVKSAPVLKKYTEGYALWLYRDYVASVLFNPSFEEGLKGWETRGEIRCERDLQGDHVALLGANCTLHQRIPARRTDAASFGYFKKATFCFNAWPVKEDRALLRIFFSSNATVGQSVVIERGQKDYCIDAPVMNQYDLILKTTGSDVGIDDLYLFAGFQSLHLYDEVGRPEGSIVAIRQLNRHLSQERERNFFDGKGLRELSGVYNDLWTGPVVEGLVDVPLNLDRYEFKMVTFLPKGWPVQPKASIVVGDVKDIPVTIKSGRSEFVFPAEKYMKFRGRRVRLKIFVKGKIRPSDYNINQDQRELGLQLLSIGFQKRKS